MILFFILAVLVIPVTAAIVLLSLFAPHKLPWYRPHLLLSANRQETVQPRSYPRQPVILEGLAEPEPERNDLDISSKEKVARLENILLEKNAAIEKLQKQISTDKNLREDFEKVKALLDEEIVSLRKQNRDLKIRQEKLNG